MESPARKSIGRFELLLELSRSHLGTLWVAHTPGKPGSELVSMRCIPTRPDLGEADIDRLSEAAWWALELSEDHLATMVDVVITEQELGQVTRYSSGETLRALLRLANFKRRPFPPRVALAVGLGVLRGQLYAQQQAQPMSGGKSYIGSGLGPDSVWLTTSGQTTLLDLGISAAAMSIPQLSEQPEVSAYRAPEELALDGDVGPPAVVFAVGTMLWEMMSGGKRLFAGGTQEAVLERVRGLDPPRLDANKQQLGEPISTPIADLIERALGRDPKRRFSGAGEMIDCILELMGVDGSPTAELGSLVEELCGNALRARDRSLERVLGRPLGAQATERAKRPGGGQWTAPGPAPQPRRAEPGSRASKAAAKLSFSKPAKAALPLPEPPAPKGRVPEKKTLLGMAPPKPVAVGLTRTATVPHPVLPSDPTSAPSEKSATMPLEPAEERRLIEALTTEIADSRPSAEIDAAAMQATAAPMTLAPAAARTAVSQHRRAGRIAALAAVLVALPLVAWALWIRARSTERQDVPSQSSALSSVDQVGAPSAVKVSEAPTATPTSAPPTFLRRPAAADQATPNADVLSAPDAAVGASAPNSDSGYESPVSKATTHAAPSTGSTSSSARRPLGAKPLTPAPHSQRAPAPKPGARFRPSGI